MPKVTDEHRQAMRLRIQDAAIACFVRRGFSRASMADIIAEADLSAGAVYVYYSSKAQLTIDVGRRIMEQRVSELDDFSSATEVSPPHEVLPKFFESFLGDHPSAALVPQVWGEAAHDREFATIAATIFDALNSRIAGYLSAYFHRSQGADMDTARVRAEQMAPAVLAMMQGAIIQASILGNASRSRVAEAIEALLANRLD